MEKLTEFVSKSFDPNKSALSVQYLAQSAARADSSDANSPDSRHDNDTSDNYRQDGVQVTFDRPSHDGTLPEGSTDLEQAQAIFKRERVNGDFRAMLPSHGPLDLHSLTGLPNLHGLPGVLPVPPVTHHLPYALPILLSHHAHNHPRRYSVSPQNFSNTSPMHHSASPPHRSSTSPPLYPRCTPPPRLTKHSPYINITRQPSSATSPPFYSSGSPPASVSPPQVSPDHVCQSPYHKAPQFEDEDVDVDVEAPESPMEEGEDYKTDLSFDTIQRAKEMTPTSFKLELTAGMKHEHILLYKHIITCMYMSNAN